MDIAKFSIEKKAIIWLMITFFIAGGWFAYENLARYEDPEFTIKDAKVITFYPGATPEEVEQEVTDRIEKAVQQLGQIKRTTSISELGKSEVTVTIKDKYTKRDLPQVWDELRRKISDMQSQLPPGAGPTIVYDDYGDVYGMLFALTGDGFSYKELKEYSDIIKRELELISGVAKVQVSGIQEQAIFVDISRSKLSQLGISLEDIYATLESQNLVTEAGEVQVGEEYIVVRATGSVDSVEDIKSLMIKSEKSDSLIFLDDIAIVSRGYIEVPNHLIYFNGQPALSIGISILSGGNVVKIGEIVDQKLDELSQLIPIGVEIYPIYQQSTIVEQSIQGFLINLLEALGIVVVVLLLFMGLRSGLIISSILLLTVMGTLFMMFIFNISLQRISLGALVIALGMLVDNAIVVTEGILVKVQQGVDTIKASRDVLKQTMWPLFGATVIGILAFAAIGLSQDATGEYTVSLFYVILISLLLSWILAITAAPLFCYLFLKAPKTPQKEASYDNAVYQSYKGMLLCCLRFRWLTVALMSGLLILAIYGFGFIKEGFFPNSTTQMFYVDYWRAQGTDIRATRDDMLRIEEYINSLDGVVEVTTLVGEGAQRFMLVYTPESPNSSYGQFLVRVEDYRKIDSLAEKITTYMANEFPDSEPKIRKIRLGPGKDSKIEIRFSGPDPVVLRELANQAEAILRTDPLAINIRNDWRQQVKVIQPHYSEQRGRLTGITRAALSDSLLMAFTGERVGIYRERDELIPIISRSPDHERLNVASLPDLQIWSPLYQQTVPLQQIVSKITTEWEDPR
ncbi:MAG: efflux RND transporter permease subunit, partial [Gammaproteobacteria bacterium]